MIVYNQNDTSIFVPAGIQKFSGGIFLDLNNCTAEPSDIILNKTAYSNTGLITGTLDLNSMLDASYNAGKQNIIDSQADANITADDVILNKVGYSANNTKITGALDLNSMLDASYNAGVTKGENNIIDGQSDANITPADVIAGKIGYSANNTRIVGEYVQQYDISEPFISLNRYQGGTSVPDFIVGWEKLVDGSYKCANSSIVVFAKNVNNLENGTDMFVSSDIESFISNTPNLKIGDYMFYSSKLITFESSDLSNLTTSTEMFGFSKYTGEFNYDMPNVTNMSWMFEYNINLTSVNINVPELLYADGSFMNCSSLKSLIMHSPKMDHCDDLLLGVTSITDLTIDFSSLTSQTGTMFESGIQLTNLTMEGTIDVACSFVRCELLTVDSLLSILNALTDRTNLEIFNCELGSGNLAKLTDEQKQIAINKNWTLS